MRVLIYGGRDWNDQTALDGALDHLHAEHHFTAVINGGQVSRDKATGELFGADWQAAVWAQAHGIPVTYFYPNWQAEGRAAGPIRNARMLNEGRPELGVEFPGGRGTSDMRRKLLAAGIQVATVAHTKTAQDCS